MPYSFPNNIPTFALKKSEAVQKVAISVFNETLKSTKSEEKARIAALDAMSNAEEEFKKRANVRKSIRSILEKSNNALGNS